MGMKTGTCEKRSQEQQRMFAHALRLGFRACCYEWRSQSQLTAFGHERLDPDEILRLRLLKQYCISHSRDCVSSGDAAQVVCGCDTFVAFPPRTPDGLVVFGKNSDRPAGEGQSIRRYPAQKYPENTSLRCTYIDIPQALSTHAVLLSQIDWMWGAEMGANECGVVIGNEAVWTKVPTGTEERLLGMDLLRLGLERGSTAGEAKDVITNLLEKYGQGGACAENDASFTYHNSFLIADSKEAWVVETAGSHWVAEKITNGSRNISNGLTIRDQFHSCSSNLMCYAKKHGLWDGEGQFDFAACFSEGGVDESPFSRQACGTTHLEKHDGSMDRNAMMEILKDHNSGICMHGSFETTSSMVSELRQDGSAQHWMTGKPHPCVNEFLPQNVKGDK